VKVAFRFKVQARGIIFSSWEMKLLVKYISFGVHLVLKAFIVLLLLKLIMLLLLFTVLLFKFIVLLLIVSVHHVVVG